MQIQLMGAVAALKQWVKRSEKPVLPPADFGVRMNTGPQADLFVRQAPVETRTPPRPRVVLFSSSRLLDGMKVGTAMIERRRSHKPIKSVVTMEKIQDDPSRPSHRDYERFNLYVKGDKVGYTELKTDKDKVWVQYMVSPGNSHFNHIGTVLHQVAVERSLDSGLDGKVALYSLSNAVGFHYKAGFRAETKATNRRIARFVRQAEKDREKQPSFDESIDMFLPESKIKTWKKRIAKSPVLDLDKVHRVS